MTEKMKELSGAFACLKDSVGELVSEIEKGRLLTDDKMDDVSRKLETVRNLQIECRAFLKENNLEDADTLDEMVRAVEEYQKNKNVRTITNVRVIFSNFLKIYTAYEPAAKALEVERSKIVKYSDSEILKMGEGYAEPYDTLYRYVENWTNGMPVPTSAENKFDHTILYAASSGKLSIYRDTPETSEEKPAAGEQTRESKDENLPVPPEIPKVESDIRTPDIPETPSEETKPDGEFSKLIKEETSQGKPVGPKAFLNDLWDKRCTNLMRSLAHFMSKNFVLLDIAMQDASEKLIQYLYKKGIIVKYYLSDKPDEYFYCFSDAGTGLLNRDMVKRDLFRGMRLDFEKAPVTVGEFVDLRNKALSATRSYFEMKEKLADKIGKEADVKNEPTEDNTRETDKKGSDEPPPADAADKADETESGEKAVPEMKAESDAESVISEDEPTAESASKLLDRNADPRNNTGDFIKFARSLIMEGRFYAALFLLYALKDISNEYDSEYEKLALSCGIDIDNKEINDDRLDNAFTDFNDTEEFCGMACALMRVAINPDTKCRINLRARIPSILDYKKSEELNELKAIFFELKGFIETGFSNGFTPHILDKLNGEKNNQENIKNLQLKAQEYLNTSKRGNNLLNLIINKMAGPGTDAYKALEVICANDSERKEFVQAFLDKYDIDDDRRLQKLQAEADKAFKEIKGNKNKTLVDPLLSKTARHFEEAHIAISRSWLEFIDAFSDDQGNVIITSGNKIKNELGSISKKLKDSATLEARLILKTANDLDAKLKSSDCENGFAEEFLRSSWIELNPDNNYFPILSDDHIKGFELWRRILLHIRDAVQERISANTYAGEDNFGFAECASKYAKQLKEPDDYADKGIAGARRDDNKKEESLKSGFDFAYMCGQIDEEDLLLQDDVLAIRQRNNFGLCSKAYDILNKFIEEKRKVKQSEMRNQIDAFMRDKQDADYPILTDIDSALDQGLILLAEDYLNRAKSGDVQGPESLPRSDYFCGFLDNEENLRQNGNLIKIYRAKPKIVEILNNLGFHTDGDLPDSKSFQNDGSASAKYIYEDIKIRPVSKNDMSYVHPFAKFGTKLTSLTVIWFPEKASADEIAQLIKTENYRDKTILVLIDDLLDKSERQALAGKLIGLPTTLVVDRLLYCHLDSLNKSEKQEPLLKCSLPYTTLHPYDGSGSGSIDEEMFFGRESECEKIISLDQNTCLVCGGRQLGKTALLRRAVSICHNPEQGNYAYFVNLDTGGFDYLVDSIRESMMADGLDIKLKPGAKGNSENFREEVEELLRKNRIKSLRLFIDEADKFLESERKDGYSNLKILRELRDKYHGKFKFVLAGLHNVSRQSHEDNSIIGNLGNACIIRPLSPVEAMNLVEKPLFYLGYRFNADDKAGKQLLSLILSSTNYYPGSLHYFCSRLIDNLEEMRKNRFKKNMTMPYAIEKQDVGNVLRKSEFNHFIKERFMMTVTIEVTYKKLAYLMAYLYITKGVREYSAQEIISEWRSNVCGEEDLRDDTIRNLLVEMTDLGVFSANEDKYRFRKSVFYNYVSDNAQIGVSEGGKYDEIVKVLLE